MTFKKLAYCLFVLTAIVLSKEAYSQTLYELPFYVFDMAFVDYDRDGDNDILSASTCDSLVFFENDGVGNLTRTDIACEVGIFLYCRDINNDNYPEIITRDADSVYYYENTGIGTYGDKINVCDTEGNRRIGGIMDMNEDSTLDIVYYSISPPWGWGIVYNYMDEGFQDEFLFSTQDKEEVAVSHLNNDSRPDVLSSTFLIEPGVYIAYNYPDQFVFDTLFDHSSFWRMNFFIDMDNDDDDDILFYKPAYTVDYHFLFLENTDTGVIIKDTIAKKNGIRPDVISDMDGDGFPDLACFTPSFDTVPSQMDSIYIFHNTGNNSFELAQQIYMGNQGSTREKVYGKDINGDGLTELMVTGYKNPTINHTRLLWNDGTGHFIDSNIYSKINNNKLSNEKIIAYPNPFNDHVLFRIHKHNALTRLEIYNIKGELVFKKNIRQVSGPLTTGWNGRNLQGNHCRPGIYFVFVYNNRNLIESFKIVKSK